MRAIGTYLQPGAFKDEGVGPQAKKKANVYVGAEQEKGVGVRGT